MENIIIILGWGLVSISLIWTLIYLIFLEKKIEFKRAYYIFKIFYNPGITVMIICIILKIFRIL